MPPIKFAEPSQEFHWSYITKQLVRNYGMPVWLEQPDIRQPRSVTIAYTVQSLLFYQIAYWEVCATYSDNGKPARFAWVANERVTPKLNARNTEVEYYTVDNEVRPQNGIGSLITFQSLQPGILATGGRTIRAALDLEKAAAIAAQTPIPSGFLKNTGADLSQEEVQAILASWKSARSQRATAYLTSTLDYVPTAFSPKDMGYVDLIQNMSLQVARLMKCPCILFKFRYEQQHDI